jgi:hypothetical protein
MSLPEMNINEGKMVDAAREASHLKGQVADLETKIKDEKKVLTGGAVELRDEQLGKNNFVGMFRVTGDDMAAVRIEMRTNKESALDVDQGPILDTMFGPARPLIFERTSVVTAITDPAQLVADLVAAGKNPWDHLTLSVRTGQDDVIAECSEAVVVQDAYLPTKDWLAKTNEILHTLPKVAIEFLKEFFVTATSPTVVLGSRGKTNKQS